MTHHDLTLKEQLDALVTRHELTEVLDRLAELVHASNAANRSQLTRLLEDATHLALMQEETTVILTLQPDRTAS